ncbi:7TMR-DISMED2 domain-containing protein [Hahella ganghwensis]|uniref:7TMR-DISMED2 domain-containing protein n=1 Tax=Hahella ganghwensis TaxID=286420 RepID=UPI00037A60FF|nr:7TM-DISM domain-containing protein [Hahella ganghwensis]
MGRVTLLVSFCLLTSISAAADAPTTSQTATPGIITWELLDTTLQQPVFQYFEDDHSHYAVEDILQSPNILWEKADTLSANFGYSESVFWFRFRLQNHADEPLKRLLVIRAPHLDEVHFSEFGPSGQLLRENISGESYPFNHREQNHPMYLYTVEIPANSAQQ